MKISLQEFMQLLETEVSAVIVNNDALVYPSYDSLTDEDENEFLFLGWEINGNDYCLKFNGGLNQTIEIVDNHVVLTDTEGDKNSLELLSIMNLNDIY